MSTKKAPPAAGDRIRAVFRRTALCYLPVVSGAIDGIPLFLTVRTLACLTKSKYVESGG